MTIYFDIETTGLKPEEEEILQLSVIDENDNVIYNSYFYPLWHSSWESAMAVNHITPQMVENCPTFAEERDKIQKIFTNVTAKGYCCNFDKKFLEYNGIDFSTVNVVDIMDKVNQRRLDDERTKYTYNRKLTTIASALGFDYNKMDAHNSLTDVYATKLVDLQL